MYIYKKKKHLKKIKLFMPIALFKDMNAIYISLLHIYQTVSTFPKTHSI